ncbi:MAG: hypothetical protein MUF18_15485 [Fimbriiglobus sp.]|jgi:hypothetical protein|nr:hypothetical protein [Fimbriiglobus sp.]
MKLRKIHWLLIAGVVVALAAVGWLPSYSFVAVSSPDGNLSVQHAGPGGIRVKTSNAEIRVNQP